MRKKVFCGNWKMHKTLNDTKMFFSEFKPVPTKVEVMFAVSPALLYAAATPDRTILAQNFFPKTEGAFTGELSINQLKDSGAKGSLIGHSERRTLFHESLQDVDEKLKLALDHELLTIVCIGETKDQREKGETYKILNAQLEGVYPFLSPQLVMIAYEPVWAIGTGLTATPAMAQEAHAWIRQSIADQRGQDLADQTRILYGGSVKADNIAELNQQADIDGFLVGGASLDPSSCKKMIQIMDAHSEN
jgi:triosephosphate isomerase (TIM)